MKNSKAIGVIDLHKKISPRSKKFIFILLVTILVCLLSAQLHTSGYCILKGRILSDDEKLNKAVAFAIDENDLIIKVHIINKNDAQKKEIYKDYSEINRYKSPKDFIERNDPCCAIIERNISPNITKDSQSVAATFVDRILGDNFDLVKIVYSAEILNDVNKKEKLYKSVFVTVDTCGFAWKTNYESFSSYLKILKQYPTEFISNSSE